MKLESCVIIRIKHMIRREVLRSKYVSVRSTIKPLNVKCLLGSHIDKGDLKNVFEIE